jgi:DNA-binding IclR family transcriptional regulator
LIADELGLTREAVYRALASLEREGRIARSDHAVKLLVPTELDVPADWHRRRPMARRRKL